VLETTLSVVEGCWDRERIARVLVNLIDNAIKYSPHGGVMTVRIAPADGRARLTVSDQGVGIAPDQIASLFRPYARLGQVDGVAGLGLGLYIVKGIVDAHEGSIWAESRPGEGSTFVVDLPLGVAGRATEPAADADLASVR